MDRTMDSLILRDRLAFLLLSGFKLSAARLSVCWLLSQPLCQCFEEVLTVNSAHENVCLPILLAQMR